MNRWTQLVHFNPNPGDPHRPNVTPIYQTATFAQEEAGVYGTYDYTRSGNPTRSIVEQQLAQLESSQFAFTFSTGMTAITALIGLLHQGDHIIAGDDLYGGTHRLLTKRIAQRGLDVSFIDTSDISACKKVIKSNTKLILIETPSNPLQKISDIRQLAALAHENAAWLAVDNTLLSPWLQQPLTLGADFVIHSATKHLAGHSDVSAGVIMVNQPTLAEQLAFIQNAEGGGLAPFESWLLLRGLKTLGLRIERQQNTAHKIAQYLLKNPAVTCVYYPTLSNHPGAEIHSTQATGGGTVISFATHSTELSTQLVNRTALFTTSVSFGSLSSLISLPCEMSHAAVADQHRLFGKNLVRLSIGIEDSEDLIADLEQAFQFNLTRTLL